MRICCLMMIALCVTALHAQDIWRSYVPDGYEVVQVDSTQFNADPFLDYVIVIQKVDPAKTFQISLYENNGKLVIYPGPLLQISKVEMADDGDANYDENNSSGDNDLYDNQSEYESYIDKHISKQIDYNTNPLDLLIVLSSGNSDDESYRLVIRKDGFLKQRFLCIEEPVYGQYSLSVRDSTTIKMGYGDLIIAQPHRQLSFCCIQERSDGSWDMMLKHYIESGPIRDVTELTIRAPLNGTIMTVTTDGNSLGFLYEEVWDCLGYQVIGQTELYNKRRTTIRTDEKQYQIWLSQIESIDEYVYP